MLALDDRHHALGVELSWATEARIRSWSGGEVRTPESSRPPADEPSARLMSRLLLGADEGREVDRLIGARWVSLWWD